jgi:hypothetical protein
VSSFFAGAADLDCAINRAIDAKLSALSWNDVVGLMKASGLRVAQKLSAKAIFKQIEPLSMAA